MAIDFTDLTAIADLLKYTYGDGLSNQFVDEKTAYHHFPKSERKPRGLGYQFGVKYARAQGTGARAESAKLPPPLVGKYDKALVYPKYMYGSLRLTGPAIEAAKGDLAAFVDGMTESVDDIYQSLVADLNRMTWGDGFGLIATMSAASDDPTTTGTAGNSWTVTCDNDQGLLWAVEGMMVDFYESTAIDVSSSGARIYSIDVINKTMEMEPVNTTDYATYHPGHVSGTITLNNATTAVTTGAYIVAMGARDAVFATSDTPIEMTGMGGIYDDGTLLDTFQDINADTFTRWRANMIGNSSVNRELSLDLMLQALDATRARSGKTVQEIYMGLGQRRKYFGLLAPDVRFTPGTFKGGYETLAFSGGDGSCEIVIDPICPTNKMFFQPRGAVEKFEMTPLGWGNLDQQIHQRAGYDEWDQFLRIYTQLGCEQRNCLTLLYDLVEPSRSY